MTAGPTSSPAPRAVVEDRALVRAPIGLVYAAITDLTRWQDWWPSVSVRSDGVREHWRLRFGGRTSGPRCTAVAGDWRHDVGFRLALDGDLVGSAEWWLEPQRGGTLVHHLLEVGHPDGGDARRRIARFRRCVRRGLWGLQSHAEAAVLLALADTADRPRAGARA